MTFAWKQSCSILLLLGTAACSANSLPALAKEAHSRVPLGMPLDRAAASMEAGGFKCQDNYMPKAEPADLLCVRTKSHYVIAVCVQRVFLAAAPHTTTVVRVHAWQPACVGM